MPDVELVSPVPVDDAEAWVRALATTFLGNPYDSDFERRIDAWRNDWLPERTWGAREHGRFVATLATDPRVVTIPGIDGATVDVPADAVTGVTVAATHRRMGLMSRMLSASLQRAKEAGEAFSVLIAAEWPIYGRFGYAPAVWAADYVYTPRIQGGAVAADRDAGRVRQVERAELIGVAPAIFDRARRRRAGNVDRSELWWSRALGQPPSTGVVGTPPHWFVHEGPDGADGIVAWKPGRDFELDGSMGTIELSGLIAATDTAYRNLWAYLGSIDIVGEIAMHALAVDESLRWMLGDARALKQTYRGDWMWLRLLDVPAALTARGYAMSGTVVLDVVDTDLGGYAAGRYRLDVHEGAATCAPTTDAADVRLSQRALAAIYLGGNSLRAITPTGWIEESTPGAIGRLDAMFATAVQPWNATGF